MASRSNERMRKQLNEGFVDVLGCISRSGGVVRDESRSCCPIRIQIRLTCEEDRS